MYKFNPGDFVRVMATTLDNFKSLGAVGQVFSGKCIYKNGKCKIFYEVVLNNQGLSDTLEFNEAALDKYVPIEKCYATVVPLCDERVRAYVKA